ncbi:MAG: hypothetical protein WA213_06880 [Terriglobales bacterium]
MKYVKPVLAAAILTAAIAWTSDDLLLRRKIARDEAYGEVNVQQRYAVHLKNKQVEYRSVKPYLEECVHSLFPHEDESPCWYVEKYADRIDEIDSGQWHFWEQ